MGFTNVLSKAKEIGGTAGDNVVKLLDEFNAALPTMRSLGFSVHDIQVSMGLLPEVSARLIGEAKAVDVKAVDEIIQKRSEQKLLVILLKALQTAYHLRDELGDLGLSTVAIDVKLGIPPKVGIGFVKHSAVAAPALAAA